MKKTAITLGILIAVLAVGLAGHGSRVVRSKESVRICIPRFGSSALVAIADELGYFVNEDLDVSLATPDLGLECIEQLAKSKVDYGVAYTTPIVNALLQNQSISVISELHSSTRNTAIIYARRSGISTPESLAGKKVALVKGTNAESLLRLYLLAHEIPSEKVVRLEAKQADIPALLYTGKADAVVIWEPFASRILDAGKNGEFGQLESSFFTEFSTIVVRRDDKAPRKETSVRLLRALLHAQEFAEGDPERARKITMKRLGLRPDELSETIWKKFRLNLGLSAVLSSMFEQEAERIRSTLRAGTPTPTLEAQKIYSKDILAEVAPELVTIK